MSVTRAPMDYEQAGELKIGQVGIANLRIRTLDVDQLIREMRERGYSDEFAAGITMAAATIGPIFPPSIPLIIFAAAAEVSAVKLLLAGAIPALVLAMFLMAQVSVMARRQNLPADTTPFDWAGFGKCFVVALPALLAAADGGTISTDAPSPDAQAQLEENLTEFAVAFFGAVPATVIAALIGVVFGGLFGLLARLARPARLARINGHSYAHLSSGMDPSANASAGNPAIGGDSPGQ